MTVVNPLEQSDEDFINSQPPVVDTAAEEAAAAAAMDTHDDGDPAPEEDDGTGDTSGSADPADTTGDDGSPDESDGSDDGEASGDGDGTAGVAESDAATGATGTDGEAKPKVDEPVVEPTGSGFTVPRVFKANGKDIELKTEAEALQLMQMGANFTRKMQELAPHRKVLMMLQNNNLLDETKLSFLIDLDKKNPEAIKKLMKDAGVDPHEVDLDSESDYLPGSHIVGEDEASFRTVVEDISSSPAGKETISIINTDWDNASKEVLWNQPELMSVFHEQRQSGVYDQIKAELDRRRAVGIIPANTPFLQAYKIVGEDMVAETLKSASNGQQSNEAQEGSQGVITPKPTPVVTRAAAPKPTVTNSDKVSAASPTRATPGQAKSIINPLAMSDDQFLKDMENRL